MRIIAILFFYALAMVSIYGGVEIAPTMTWPHTPVEMGAAMLLVLGMVSKCVGHYVLAMTR